MRFFFILIISITIWITYSSYPFVYGADAGLKKRCLTQRFGVPGKNNFRDINTSYTRGPFGLSVQLFDRIFRPHPFGTSSVNEYAGKMDTSYADSICIPNPDVLDGQPVYSIAEKNAEFPGGQGALISYVMKNLQYPKEQEVWQGSVIVTFVIDTLGRVRNECVLRRNNSEVLSTIEQVLLEVIHGMPKWSPAELNRRKVYMRIILPIRF